MTFRGFLITAFVVYHVFAVGVCLAASTELSAFHKDIKACEAQNQTEFELVKIFLTVLSEDEVAEINNACGGRVVVGGPKTKINTRQAVAALQKLAQIRDAKEYPERLGTFGRQPAIPVGIGKPLWDYFKWLEASRQPNFEHRSLMGRYGTHRSEDRLVLEHYADYLVDVLDKHQQLHEIVKRRRIKCFPQRPCFFTSTSRFPISPEALYNGTSYISVKNRQYERAPFIGLPAIWNGILRRSPDLYSNVKVITTVRLWFEYLVMSDLLVAESTTRDMSNWVRHLQEHIEVPKESGGVAIAVPAPVEELAYSTISSPKVRVQLRNSRSIFEAALKGADNDFSRCRKKFQHLFIVHHNALISEPGNQEVTEYLKMVIDKMIYFADSCEKRGSDAIATNPSQAAACFQQAHICYSELVKVYPTQPEYEKRSLIARRRHAELLVRADLLRLSRTDNLVAAMSAFKSMVTSHRNFTKAHGGDEQLKAAVTAASAEIEKQIQTSWHNSDADLVEMKLELIDHQQSLTDFSKDAGMQANLSQMAEEFNRLLKDQADRSIAIAKNVQQAFENQDYVEAEALCQEITRIWQPLQRVIESNHPLVNQTIVTREVANLARLAGRHAAVAVYCRQLLDLVTSRARKLATANADDVQRLFADVAQQAKADEVYARDDISDNAVRGALKSSLTLLINTAEKLMKNDELYVSYLVFGHTVTLASSDGRLTDQVAALKQKHLAATKRIREIDPSKIDNMELANLCYAPMSYNEWEALARKGNFERIHVSFRGAVQQMLGGETIILKEPSVEIRLKRKRLLREGDSISGIGLFTETVTRKSVSGVPMELPVFKEAYLESTVLASKGTEDYFLNNFSFLGLKLGMSQDTATRTLKTTAKDADLLLTGSDDLIIMFNRQRTMVARVNFENGAVAHIDLHASLLRIPVRAMVGFTNDSLSGWLEREYGFVLGEDGRYSSQTVEISKTETFYIRFRAHKP